MYSVRLIVSIATAAAITIMWDSTLLFSLKQFVVYLHELWHALISMAAGAKVEKIILHSGESGETLVKDLNGHFAFIAAVSAGYLGSVITGAFFLNRGILGSGEKITAGFAGIMILFLTFMLTDPGSSAFWTGLTFGGGITFLAVLPRIVSRYVLIILGTAIVWYSVFDMLDFTQDVNRSDAGILSAYLMNKELLPADESFRSFYSYTISLLWSFVMLLSLWLFIRPLLKTKATGEAVDPSLQSDLSQTVNNTEDSLISEIQESPQKNNV